MASLRLLMCKRMPIIVTQLVPKYIINSCKQNLSSKSIFNEISNNLIKNNSINLIKFNKKCLFHTSPKRYNPILAIVLRTVAKFVAVFTGRAIRKWWTDLPPNKRQLVYEWLLRNKWRIGLGMASIVLVFYVYYLSHLKETPITKRKRFIAFTSKQLKQINDYELEVQIQMFSEKLLSSTDPKSRRVARVATQLLNANNDLPQIHDNEWSISVVNDDNIKNAFVLPSGQIFVFTGMLALCDNDQQLGVILAHEMAHAILAHGAELVSHAHLIDLVFICIIGIIWTLLPTDWTAAIASGISRFIMRIILDSPYSRMLETEADIVGLQLAAKACLDVRETSAFWHKMSILDNTKGIQFASDNIKIPKNLEFLSTHPSHESRYIYLDSIMESAIQLRTNCNCPQLPIYDPRLNIEALKKSIEDYHKQKRTDGIIYLTKPPVPPNLKKS